MSTPQLTPTPTTGRVPRLRFPEFREAGDWEEVKLGDYSTLISKRVGSASYIPLSVVTGVGLISQQEKFGRIIAGEQLKNYFVIEKNDFAYNKSATKDYPEGFLTMYTGDVPGCVPNSIFSCFRVNKAELLPKFLNYLFENNHHGRELQQFIEVGARANGALNINNNDLLSIGIPRPAGSQSIVEQQKIADCLTSLDELTQLETRKLEALKRYKQGLLQRLFPLPGETVPRLRFPEYREVGDWEEVTINQVAKFISNGKANAEDHVEGGRYPLFDRSDTVKNSPEYLFDGEAIIIPGEGMKFTPRYFVGKFNLHQRAYALMQFNEVGNFVFHAIDHYKEKLARKAVKSTVLSLRLPIIQDFELPFPQKLEQQKIADCLTSLDKLTQLETRKLEALKRYKLSLMQQLFPVMEAAEV